MKSSFWITTRIIIGTELEIEGPEVTGNRSAHTMLKVKTYFIHTSINIFGENLGLYFGNSRSSLNKLPIFMIWHETQIGNVDLATNENKHTLVIAFKARKLFNLKP